MCLIFQHLLLLMVSCYLPVLGLNPYALGYHTQKLNIVVLLLFQWTEWLGIEMKGKWSNWVTKMVLMLGVASQCTL